MINMITIQGNLVNDPVLSKTDGGASVVNVTLACRRDRHGTGKDADYIRATAWEGRAEYLSKRFHKGDNIIVTGRVEEIARTPKSGTPYTYLEVRIERIESGVTAEMRKAVRGDRPPVHKEHKERKGKPY